MLKTTVPLIPPFIRVEGFFRQPHIARRFLEMKKGLSLSPAPGKWFRSELDLDVEVQETLRAVLVGGNPELRGVGHVKSRVNELHVVEQIHRMDSEVQLDPLGNGCDLGQRSIQVPARVAAENAAAGPEVGEKRFTEEPGRSRGR